MNKIVLSFLLTVCFYNVSAQTKPKFEIRTGLVGQFYLAESRNINKQGTGGISQLPMEGGDGRSASIGGGVLMNLLYRTEKNLSISISPILRYALLETQSPAGFYVPDRWGLTLDLHSSLQWKLHAKNWLFRKSSLGLGLSLLNIGQPFDTKYKWATVAGQYEYQATTLMTFGVHALYERTLSERFTVKLIAIYTSGNWINWTPFLDATVHGNISVQYRIFNK